jgi:hypothetical protein
MKYLFILLFSLLVPFMAKSQTVYHNSAVMNTSNYNTWLQCENSGRGQGSFGMMTYTTGEKENDGYYYYDIYLINNSHYQNGAVCSSYIKGIKVYAWDGKQWINMINFSYALVNPADETFDGYFHLAFLYNTVKIQKIKVTWSSVSIY